MVLCNEQQKSCSTIPDDLFDNGNPTLEDLFRFNAARGEYGPGDADEHVARRMALVRSAQPTSTSAPARMARSLEIRGVPLEGGGFVTTYLDVTEQRRNQALIAHMAHHDALTELPNRALFADRLRTAIALAKRGGMMAVHYLDLDDFKPVNDTARAQAGDERWWRSPRGCAERCARTTPWRGSAATSSPSCRPASARQTDAAVLARRVLSHLRRRPSSLAAPS